QCQYVVIACTNFRATDTETDSIGKPICIWRRDERLLESRGSATCLRFATRHQNQKLIAAPSKDVVNLADVANEKCRDALKDAISFVVTECVVDSLEAIDVDEHERQWNVISTMTLDLAADDLIEVPSISTAGQRIGRHHLPKFVLRRLQACVRDPKFVGH